MENLVGVEHINKKYQWEYVRVEWNIGKRCNFDCSYCPSNLHDNISKHMDFEKFKIVAKTLNEIYSGRLVRLSLTGGEPFVHPHILQILWMLREYKVINEISSISNGSLPLNKYLKALPALNSLLFSWHFEHVRTDHMKSVLLGVKEKLCTDSKMFVNQHMHVHLMFLPGRLPEIKSTVDWLNDNQIQFVIRRIRPLYNPNGGYNLPGSSGMTGTHKPNNSITPYYSQEELEFLAKFQKAGTNSDNCTIYTEKDGCITAQHDNVNTLLKAQLNSFVGWNCAAGFESLYIENDGNIYPATCKVGGPVGNIFDGDFDSLVHQLIAKLLINDNDGIVCTKKWCNCAADLNITKIKPGYNHVRGLYDV